jgi:hypothetical protein
MRWLIKILLTASLVITSTAYAFNPKSEWYAGLIIGANYAGNVPFTYDVTVSGITGATVERSGQLGHDIMGNIGGQVGYRWCDNFRFEFEAIFNSSPYAYLRFENITFHDLSSSSGLRFSGKTQSGVATVNAFYDFFGDYSSHAVPYIGGGLGFAYINNKFNFYKNDVLLGTKLNDFLEENYGFTLDGNSRSGLVGQAIVGLGYFLDDYAYFALDARYMVSSSQTFLARQTRRTTNQFDVKYRLYTFNIIFNSAFDSA